jgi:hypothetical protein
MQKTNHKTERVAPVACSDLLGIIEFAIITSKNNRTITLDFLNGHPVKLTRRQAAGLCKIIESCLRDTKPESSIPYSVSVRQAGAITMSGRPASLYRLKVYSATSIQNETSQTQPRKNHRGCNQAEKVVGSYKRSMMSNARAQAPPPETDAGCKDDGQISWSRQN